MRSKKYISRVLAAAMCCVMCGCALVKNTSVDEVYLTPDTPSHSEAASENVSKNESKPESKAESKTESKKTESEKSEPKSESKKTESKKSESKTESKKAESKIESKAESKAGSKIESKPAAKPESTAEPSVSSAAEVNKTVEYKRMYLTEDAAARLSPEDGAAIGIYILKDTPVMAGAWGGGWYEVDSDGVKLYVKADQLTTTEPITEQQQPEQPKDESSTPEQQIEQPPVRPERTNGKKLIVIDAGHQQYANYEQEPIAPGASETKMKVSGGTGGVVSGLAEYELTLMLALELQPMLEERGYEVIQVRTSNDVDISNSERAAVANNANADAFIRIHANGSDDPSANGAMTICQTSYNPYNGYLYNESRALSECVLDELVAAADCRREYVWETDTMSGINWAQVPVTIVEVGYMSNPSEDTLLSTEDYRTKLCTGIANGIDRYFAEE